MVFNMSSFKFTSMQYPRNWANNPTYWYIFFWMVNLYFVCPLNRQANLTNEHCTSESVFVACAHIANVNDLLRVQIPHPSSLIPHSSSLSHNFSFNPPFSAVTLMYPSSETQGLWVDFKSGQKSPFRPDLKSTHSPWVSKDVVYLNNTFSILQEFNSMVWS